MYNHENPGRTDTIEQVPIHTLDLAFSSPNREGPPLSLTSRAQLDTAAVIPDVELSLQVRDHIRQIVTKEVAQKQAKQLKEATQQAVKSDFLSDIIFTGYNRAERELKKVSYRFSDTVLTNMAVKGTSYELFGRSIKQ